MSDNASLCYIVVAVATIGLVIFGFNKILTPQQHSENDTQVIQRQIRGFAWLMLSQIVLVLGSSMCMGMGFTLRDVSRSLSMKN